MTEHIASWLFTYALHSTVLLAAAWLVTWRLVRSHDVRDVIWKSALVGSLITTTLQAGLGFVPVGGLVSIVGMGAAPAERHATAPRESRSGSEPRGGKESDRRDAGHWAALQRCQGNLGTDGSRGGGDATGARAG